jgi:hypothetical protein
VDQLDPLSPALRLEDFERPTSEFGSDDEKWKKGVARLLGVPWKDAWKIGKDYVMRQRKDPHDHWYSYRDKSVFEWSLYSMTLFHLRASARLLLLCFLATPTQVSFTPASTLRISR